MPVLIHELITAELWREKVFSQLFKIDFEPKNTFVMYLIVSIYSDMIRSQNLKDLFKNMTFVNKKKALSRGHFSEFARDNSLSSRRVSISGGYHL